MPLQVSVLEPNGPRESVITIFRLLSQAKHAHQQLETDS